MKDGGIPYGNKPTVDVQAEADMRKSELIWEAIEAQTRVNEVQEIFRQYPQAAEFININEAVTARDDAIQRVAELMRDPEGDE